MKTLEQIYADAVDDVNLCWLEELNLIKQEYFNAGKTHKTLEEYEAHKSAAKEENNF